MSITAVLLIVGLTVLHGSITSALKFTSPCPGLFHYDSTDQPNQWIGTVTLLSEAELHGIWLRLIFDEKLTELNVPDGFGEVIQADNKKEYLIKNREFVLKPGTPIDIKIVVKYDGDKVPTLSGYRLNARTVCSSPEGFGQIFPGDLQGADFLTPIVSQAKISGNGFEGCGTAPLSSKQNGRWPWQGTLHIQNNNEEKYVCETTLISPKHVLTPAHCVTYQKSQLAVPVRELTVYLGGYGLNRDGDGNIQKFNIEKVLVHPGYRSEQLEDDLAVVQLSKSVVINDYVRPICLEKSKESEGFLVGFEIKDNNFKDLTGIKMNLVDEEKCLKENSNLRGLLRDNVLCASYLNDDDKCVGDSGSSLLVSLREGEKSVWGLKGIVSVGVALQNKNKCDTSTRVLLVDIANYLKWIKAVAF